MQGLFRRRVEINIGCKCLILRGRSRLLDGIRSIICLPEETLHRHDLNTFVLCKLQMSLQAMPALFRRRVEINTG